MAENKQAGSETDMTVGEHLDELRRHITKALIALGVVAVVLFCIPGIVVDAVFWPTLPEFPTNQLFGKAARLFGKEFLAINDFDLNIVNTKMAGQFMLHIKSSIIGAILIAFPYLIWQLWIFIKPALSFDIIRRSRSIVFQVSCWFFVGLAFGYFIIAPLAVNFLGAYQVSTNITNMIEVDSFLSTVLGVSLAAALIFQLPVLVKLLATIGILHASFMRKYRKHAIVVILIVAAIITPPDVISQILIAIPLYGLYEFGIRQTERIEKAKAQEEVDINTPTKQ